MKAVATVPTAGAAATVVATITIVIMEKTKAAAAATSCSNATSSRPSPPTGLPIKGEVEGTTVLRAPPPLVPVRCYSCGLQIETRHAAYRRLVEAGGVSPAVALDKCGAVRICCRRMILSQPTAPDRLDVVFTPNPDCSPE